MFRLGFLQPIEAALGLPIVRVRTSLLISTFSAIVCTGCLGSPVDLPADPNVQLMVTPYHPQPAEPGTGTYNVAVVPTRNALFAA